MFDRLIEHVKKQAPRHLAEQHSAESRGVIFNLTKRVSAQCHSIKCWTAELCYSAVRCAAKCRWT